MFLYSAFNVAVRIVRVNGIFVFRLVHSTFNMSWSLYSYVLKVPIDTYNADFMKYRSFVRI